jgi:hypothetical protein
LAGTLALAAAAAWAQPGEPVPPTADGQYGLLLDDPFELGDGSQDGSVYEQHGVPSGPRGDLLIDRHGDMMLPGGPIAPYLLPGAHNGPRHDPWAASDGPPPTYSPCLTRLGLRHSYTHGRNVGWGGPLVGSSWLNRPYYTGLALGPLWVTQPLTSSVGRDTDLMGSVFLGWDWDYYWGSEFEYAYATPELVNERAPSAPRGDRLVHWNYSLMYYPWGDATLRPYWRLGVGNTKVDFPNDAGVRRDQWLLSFPVGVGLKYPLRRWLAARVEFTDQISVGDNGIATQHNLALLFGVECRFGARPKSYWPWNPSSYIW